MLRAKGGNKKLEPLSFVHVADLHLGYTQYNLDARREDFNKAFTEVVDKTIELKPDFIVIAGDIFHHARPSNVTLEAAIKNFRRLRDASIPVLAVDGSHDSAPNTITGTVLNPLDAAGLLYYLPRHNGAYKQNKKCYIYGVPNYRTRRKTEESLPLFYEENKPAPDPELYNIFVFHMAIDFPRIKPPQMEAEAPPELLPVGFNYYAGGHVHKPSRSNFKTGTLAYSGSTETVYYDDAGIKKGLYYVEVSKNGEAKFQHVKLESPRHFVILKKDYTNMPLTKISSTAVQHVKENDEEGIIMVPVLEGTLPAEANRSEINVSQIRNAAEKALLVHPIIRLRETEIPEEVVRSIFEGELKDLKTKAFEYFLQIFSERYTRDNAEKIARLSVNLIEPLSRKDENKAKEMLESHLNAN
ncbi:MAG: DNA repair exonuclease [Candidatus Bathyarchaeota archaeon]|nr:MAG: DNA repair exonuclease [Candidatus Bathyarchaeota archaeon]